MPQPTATEVYKAVLEELLHYNTTSMSPEQFNYRIWDAELTYVTNRYWAHEQHQKSIDDLDVIKVVTDGVAGFPAPLVALGPGTAGTEYIELPEDYLHLTAVSAKVKYKNVPCQEDGSLSNYIACTPLKDDKRWAVDDDFYQEPIAEWPNLYYDQRGKKMTFRAGDSIVQSVMLAYLRYPKRIFFDVNNVAHVDSEFTWKQTIEIVKLCAQIYIEAIESPRINTQPIITEQKNFLQTPPPNVIS